MYFLGIYAAVLLKLFFNFPFSGLRITRPFCFLTLRATQTGFPPPAAWRAGCFLPIPRVSCGTGGAYCGTRLACPFAPPSGWEGCLSPNFLADSVPPWSLLGVSPWPPQGAGMSLLRGQALPLAWGPSGRAVCDRVSLSCPGAQPWRAHAVCVCVSPRVPL